MAKDKSKQPVEDGDVTMTEAADSPKKKSKKEKEDIDIGSLELSPIAHPLAQKKLWKKLHKTLRKASKQRQVKRGVKEVVKGIRKGDKGLLVLAADISPIDIIAHLPIMSEEAHIPYIFVHSKEELGQASATKRPTSCVLICPDGKKKKAKKDGKDAEEEEDYREMYDECLKEVKKLDQRVVF
ncbi:L30e-like protein [Exidia glandulosa HHB12029]|uniref:H/ACA ribonucleoprotein complex subunit 2 n=1 Tax=Exidia glandulosa HHB12029 TaxID=1314781 RepID=A0A165QSQ8_EXIGL|nr:L30e-like protein [Exidia glandulosa HHB12029]